MRKTGDEGARGVAGATFAQSLVGRIPPTVPGLLATLLVLTLHVAGLPVLNQLGNLLFDAYQRTAPRQYEDAPVRVVDIDDETIRRLGQWPWPRTDVARLTQALTDAGAAAIAFDIVFSEPDRTSPARAAQILRQNPLAKDDFAEVAALEDHDKLFGQTLGQSPAVMGFFMTREVNPVRPAMKSGMATSGTPPLGALLGYNGAIAPLTTLSAAAPGAGFVSIVGDGDGIIRRAPLLSRIGEDIVPSLSLEALRVAQGAGAILIRGTDASGELGGGEPGVVALKVGDFEIPTTRVGELWMHYTKPHPERIVPAWKILEGKLPPQEMQRLFGGRITFVGTGAAGLRDLVATPVVDRDLGVNVHAQAVEQVILGKFLIRPDWAPGVERLVILLFGIGLALLLPKTGAALGSLLAIGALAAVGGTSWYAFREQGLLIDPTYPVFGVVLAYVSVTFFSFYREERMRAYIRRAFDRYLSPELVERIAKDPGQLELGGEERDMTVMFCDVRSFSRISEALSPQEIIKFLIEFLTPMTDILLQRKATIDKYIGDAILAFWNAPLDDPQHPENAARGALGMVDKLRELNAFYAANPSHLWPGEVKIGIGLNTGRCCVGNMGSAQRLSYSLIGDTVNLASRIEGLTKQYGVTIAVGSATASQIAGFALLEIDRVRVVGRDAPETLYALLGTPEDAADPAFAALSGAHGAMLDAYRAQDWDAAETSLASAKNLTGRFISPMLHDVYAERISAYRAAPPGEGWDGVFQATEK